MSMRNKAFALLATAALGASFAAHADAPIKVVDMGIEADSATLLMPSTDLGSVVMTCDTCKSRSYELTRETQYFVDKRSVSFAEFSTYLRGPGVRNVMVFIKPDKPEVTRMRVAP